MEVVLYFMLLVMAFGAGVGLAWKLKLANKFVTQRQLDKTLAEQRVMRNLMDEEIAIISADHQKDLESFDRQLNPPKIETVQGQLVGETSQEGPTVYMALPTRTTVPMPNVYIQPTGCKKPEEPFWPKPEEPMTNTFVARGLLPGRMMPGHSVNCACDLCLNKRHTPATIDCGCQSCAAKILLQDYARSPITYHSNDGYTSWSQSCYESLSGYERQAMQQYLTIEPPAAYFTGYCSLCHGVCIATPTHRIDPHLSNTSAR